MKQNGERSNFKVKCIKKNNFKVKVHQTLAKCNFQPELQPGVSICNVNWLEVHVYK